MKPITHILNSSCLLLLVFLLHSCWDVDTCKTHDSIYREPFTKDQLQWIKVSDSLPRFKITYKDEQGIMQVDTLQGTYTSTLSDKNKLSEDECQSIFYQEGRNSLSLPKATANYGNIFEISNDPEFNGKSIYYDSGYMQESKLDTSLINGKEYSNVYKYTYSDNTSITAIYYAKGIGYIYIRRKESFFQTDQTIELIP